MRCFRNIDKSTLRRVYHAYQACVQRNLRFRCTLLSIAFDFFYLFLTTNLPHSQSTVYNFLTSSTESPVFFAMTSMGISDCLRFLAISRLSCAAPMPSLGSLANAARAGISEYSYKLIFPAMMICLITLACNLLGDGLRDAFDPKLRR